MAIRKHIVKMNHIESLIKVVNDVDAEGTVTIDLDADLLKDNEHLVSGTTPRVAISAMEWSVKDSTGIIKIVRNGINTHTLFATRNITNAYGADHDGADSNIVITMTAGTLYIRLLKISGFRPDFQPEQNGGL